MTGITRNLLGVALATSLIAAAGCNFLRGSDRADVQAFDTPAQVLATEAETLYLDGDYEKAAETFQQIKDRFPYSRYALLADLRVGDAYLKSKRYEEALLAYDDFIRLHPKNEAVPYAISRWAWSTTPRYSPRTWTPPTPARRPRTSSVFSRSTPRANGPSRPSPL